MSYGILPYSKLIDKIVFDFRSPGRSSKDVNWILLHFPHFDFHYYTSFIDVLSLNDSCLPLLSFNVGQWLDR